MGELGDLYEKRTRLQKDLAELKARMAQMAQSLGKVAAVLAEPDKYAFSDGAYSMNQYLQTKGTATVREAVFDPETILSTHSQYFRLSHELQSVERAINEKGGSL